MKRMDEDFIHLEEIICPKCGQKTAMFCNCDPSKSEGAYACTNKNCYLDKPGKGGNRNYHFDNNPLLQLILHLLEDIK